MVILNRKGYLLLQTVFTSFRYTIKSEQGINGGQTKDIVIPNLGDDAIAYLAVNPTNKSRNGLCNIQQKYISLKRQCENLAAAGKGGNGPVGVFEPGGVLTTRFSVTGMISVRSCHFFDNISFV